MQAMIAMQREKDILSASRMFSARWVPRQTRRKSNVYYSWQIGPKCKRKTTKHVHLGIAMLLLVQVGVKGRHELGEGICRCAGHDGLTQLLGGRMQREGQAHPWQVLRQLHETLLSFQSWQQRDSLNLHLCRAHSADHHVSGNGNRDVAVKNVASFACEEELQRPVAYPGRNLNSSVCLLLKW